MKKYLWILLFLLIACSSKKLIKYPLNEQLSPKKLQLREINQKIESKNYATAIVLTDKFINKHPFDLAGYKNLAKLMDLTKKDAEKIKVVKRDYLNSLVKSNAPDSLYLQIDYLFTSYLDSASAEKLKQKLIDSYPNSTISNTLAQKKIYNLIIERDDSLRIKKLTNFLGNYGKTKWTPLAWKYLLYSYDETGSKNKLDSVLTYIEKNKFKPFKMKNLVAAYRVDRGDSLDKYERIMQKS